MSLKSIKETVYPDFTISTCDFGLRISCTCPSATNRIESAELEKLTLILERPGTTKGKIDAHDIWVVEIKMPKVLIGNFKHGKDEIESQDATDMASGELSNLNDIS